MPSVTNEPGDADRSVNHVLLVGRVADDAREVVLPSGDHVCTFRLVVPRAAGSGSPTGGRVDTIDCTVWRASVARRVLRYPAGCTVRVEGRLHRRFWRSQAGPRSRYEVEVLSARREP